MSDAMRGPGIAHLLLPKFLSARARARHHPRGRGARRLVLGAAATVFWGLAFAVVYRLLLYFRGVDEIGPFLAGKLLGLVLLSFSSILLLSNVITSLSTFFLARDLDMLASAPLDWRRLYLAKVAETLIDSSWMVLLMAVPIFTAYGLAYHGGPLYPLLVALVLVPFLVIPAAVGCAFTLLLVTVFPARRSREILSVVAVLAGAGLLVTLRLARPERLVRPEGFQSLVDFVTALRTPTSPLLPSEWAQRSVMAWLDGGIDLGAMALLWVASAVLLIVGAGLHRVFYPRGFTNAQISAGRGGPAESRAARAAHLLLSPLGPLRRELILKEVRLFFRDTAQWSQLVLLAVLVVVYVVNVKFLPMGQGGVSYFLVNVIPFLNLLLAGFVLASVAARFIFPSVSLEGRTLWLLRSSPVRMRDLLWAKFWTGTIPLLVLALGIVGATDALLGVTPFIFAVSLLTVTMMTMAVSALALGFGTLYPQFEAESAAQIPTSFGGLLFMMAAALTIGLVVVLEAQPVYAYLKAQARGTTPAVGELVWGLGLAAVVCLIATLLPIHVALRKLETLER